MKNTKVPDNCIAALAFVLSAVMLTVIQPPIGLGWLAWVALVPFVLVCSPKANPKTLAVLAYLVSLGYWLGSLYWMVPVTWSGWLAFCLYTALLWPILVYGVRFCRIKKIPLFIVVPILVVGAERLQGVFLGGFYWRHLSHSQYANISLIQIADIFGAAGVSFLVAMVNGFLAELIIAVRRGTVFKLGFLLKTVVVCGAVAGTLVYGQWRISQTDKFVEAGPMVASVQSNVPQSVKESHQAEEAIFNELMENSKASTAAGAELVVWPETMVQAILDKGVWPFLVSTENSKLFDKALGEHAKNTAYLLVGAPGGRIGRRDDANIYLDRYNSAFFYKPDGTQAAEKYNKIHLVPFGEVVPFKKSFPWLYNLLMKFTPYDYDYTLAYGTEYTVFRMAGAKGPETTAYKFAVMICYEGTVPAIARKFALDDWGRKRVDWLVNISNDGWFVRFKNSKVLPSTELAQHAAICAFRAVENRIAVLRSVNTGISCLIDTLGHVKNGFSQGNLPNKAMARKGMSGWFVDKMPIDRRVTFFSKHGQWLDFCCAGALVLVTAVQLLARFVRKRTAK